MLQALQAVLTPERQQQLDERPLQAGELAAQLITQPPIEADAEAALVAWHLAPPEPPPDPKAKVLSSADCISMSETLCMPELMSSSVGGPHSPEGGRCIHCTWPGCESLDAECVQDAKKK